MIAARYKALYLTYFNSFVRSVERWSDIILALTSSGAVAGWLLWQQLPWVWAAIIGLAQLIKVLKPHLPFLKEQQRLAASYVFYQQQYYHYECLWEDMEAGGLSDEELRQRYRDIKSRQLEEDERSAHFRVHEYRFLVRKTERDWREDLRNNYQIETNYE